MPEFGQRLLHNVERTHRHAAGGDQQVGAQQLALEDVEQLRVVVGDDPVAPRVGAGILRRRGDQVRVRVGDLAEPRLLPDVDQLAAGADHEHARTRAHEHPVASDRCQQRDLLRSEGGARTQGGLTRLQVLTGPSDAFAVAHGAMHRDPGDTAVGVLERDDRVGAGGDRRARHDAHGEPRAHARARLRARGDVADDGQRHRLLGAGVLRVDGAHRVPVHGRVVEAGQRHLGGHGLGEQQTLRIEQRQLDRLDRADSGEHRLEMLVDRAPATAVSSASGRVSHASFLRRQDEDTYSRSHALNS